MAITQPILKLGFCIVVDLEDDNDNNSNNFFIAFYVFFILMPFFIFAEQSEANHCEAASISKPHAILVYFICRKLPQTHPSFSSQKWQIMKKMC